ncbi:MAG TPA: sulfite exporter TauE/SafE family protein [Geopsychrobacteraceae bacterium]|nr:sulfite exporter TauE/SafE family protein [Geopsychrobacteraceae bacterium]
MLSLPLILMLMFFGAFAGFMAGLLGIGGGVILVPLFLWFFPLADLPPEIIVHTAFGTSLAIIIPTSISSTYGHRKHGNVAWKQVLFLAGGGIIGALIGSSLAALLSGPALKVCFGAMQVTIGLKLLFFHPHLPPEYEKKPSWQPLAAVGLVGGCFSSFFGVGGGVVAVPLMLILLRMPIHLAVGNSSALIVVSSLAGALSYVWFGMQAQVQTPWSLGYVNLTVAAIIAPMTIVFARLGVRIANKVSQDRLLSAFAVLLILIGAKMVLRL